MPRDGAMRAPQAEDVLTPLARQMFELAPGAGVPDDTLPPGARVWREGSAGAPTAGARVVVRIALDAADRVAALRWRAWGCPHTLATLGWLSQQWIGRTLADPPQGGPAGWARTLGVPVEKLGRLLLVEDAILACRNREPVIAGTAGAPPGPT